VSSRRSATQSQSLLSLSPSAVPWWDLEVGDRTEALVKYPLRISGSGDPDVGVDRVADDRRERLALAAPASVECLALLLGQIDLRSDSSHIQHNIQHGVALSAHLPFIRTVLA
jgi:hypothetical protein